MKINLSKPVSYENQGAFHYLSVLTGHTCNQERKTAVHTNLNLNLKWKKVSNNGKNIVLYI